MEVSAFLSSISKSSWVARRENQIVLEFSITDPSTTICCLVKSFGY